MAVWLDVHNYLGVDTTYFSSREEAEKWLKDEFFRPATAEEQLEKKEFVLDAGEYTRTTKYGDRKMTTEDKWARMRVAEAPPREDGTWRGQPKGCMLTRDRD